MISGGEGLKVRAMTVKGIDSALKGALLATIVSVPATLTKLVFEPEIVTGVLTIVICVLFGALIGHLVDL